MSRLVIFYNNRSDENVSNKSITEVNRFSIDNICDLNSKTPVLKISINTTSTNNWKWQFNSSAKNGVNYCELVGKFYYIDKTEIKSKFLYFYLRCDVLMTYKQAILDSYQLVTRSEKYFNRYLNDENYKALNYNRLQFKRFPAGFTGDYKYIMLVGGGS